MTQLSEDGQFQQELAKMNRDFLTFICKELETFPGADLTPTIKSYMKNVETLDDKYSNECKENQCPPPKQSRVVIPINKNLQQLRKKVQLNPTLEGLLQSPRTPASSKSNK